MLYAEEERGGVREREGAKDVDGPLFPVALAKVPGR